MRHREAAAGAGRRQPADQRDAALPQPLADDPPDGCRRSTRGEAKLDPQKLPIELKTALDALYGHYVKTFRAWETRRRRHAAGLHRRLQQHDELRARRRVHRRLRARDAPRASVDFHQGALELFRNFTDDGERLHRPRTLLIDSQQIDSGEAIAAAFRDVYARRDRHLPPREGAPRGRRGRRRPSPTEDILREVMNTVGRKGRLGEQIRCVVSVSMLTEGWDANTVTHILGLRAFGTKLICEQVIGRALRRLSYDPDPETGLFAVEYADIMGIDGLNFSAQASRPARSRRARPIHVHAVPRPRRARDHLPPRRGLPPRAPRRAPRRRLLEARALRPRPRQGRRHPRSTMSGIIGEPETITLEHLQGHAPLRARSSSSPPTSSPHAARRRRAPEAPPLPAGQGDRPRSGSTPASSSARAAPSRPSSAYRQLADEVCDLHRRRHQHQPRPARAIVRAVLDPYNPEGSTADVNFTTAQTDRWQPRPDAQPRQLDRPRQRLGGASSPSAHRGPPPRHRLRQEPQPRLRGPLPLASGEPPPLPPRLPRPPRRRHGPTSPSSSRSRASAATTPPLKAADRCATKWDPRRQPPRPLRPWAFAEFRDIPSPWPTDSSTARIAETPATAERRSHDRQDPASRAITHRDASAAPTSRRPSSSPSSTTPTAARSAPPGTAATPTSTRSSSGAARTSPTGPTSSSRPRRSTSRSRSTPRR